MSVGTQLIGRARWVMQEPPEAGGSRPSANIRGPIALMRNALAVGLIAILLIGGAPAADVVSHAAAARLSTLAIDRIDSLALRTQRPSPHSIPGLSRIHRPTHAARHVRAARGARRSTASGYAHSLIVTGLAPSQSRLETLRAALPVRVGGALRAPRRQSLLRSQARCALLPAATPRMMGASRDASLS